MTHYASFEAMPPKRARSDKRLAADHLGQRFGTRVVIGEGVSPTGEQTNWWQMRCDCGNESPVSANVLFAGKALTCLGCAKTAKLGAQHACWKGFGPVPSTAYNHFRHSAIKRDIAWEITIEDVAALYEAQGGVCAMTGRPLIFRRGNRHPGRHLASLDRVKNDQPYVRGNLQLVTGDVNMAKQCLSMEDFVALCRDVVRLADG